MSGSLLAKLRKRLKQMRCSIIVTLVGLNLLMALYTVPLLLNNRDANPDAARIVVMKRFANDSDAAETSHDHNFLYELQATTGCEADDAFLLIAVCSAVHHFDLRQAIRETWASAIHRHKLSTKLVFVLGAPPAEYRHVQTNVAHESRKYGDVIQESFVDAYPNLTVKTIAVLKWATTFCPGVRFVMKTDDDVFVNVANLVNLLMDTLARGSTAGGASGYMIGSRIENARPITDRNSKWFSPASLLDTYPTYLSGSAYVISGSAVGGLYAAATSREPFWLEDVYVTGILTAQLGIQLIGNDKFTYRRPKMANPCFYRSVVTAHELSSDDLRRIWRDLHVTDADCSRSYKRRSAR